MTFKTYKISINSFPHHQCTTFSLLVDLLRSSTSQNLNKRLQHEIQGDTTLKAIESESTRIIGTEVLILVQLKLAIRPRANTIISHFILLLLSRSLSRPLSLPSSLSLLPLFSRSLFLSLSNSWALSRCLSLSLSPSFSLSLSLLDLR